MVRAADLERRHVRVTLEGEAYSPAPGVLMVVLPDGGKVCLSERPGVTVEDVAPPRTWTDGDAILDGFTGDVFVRRGGSWTAPDRGTYEDDTMEADLKNGDTVLRYQAGDQ